MSLGFSAGARQGFRVGIDPRDLGGGIQGLCQDGHVACSATDFENPVARTDGCLKDELPVGGPYTEELGEWIEEREEPVSSRC